MQEILKLFKETRKRRLYVEAAVCAIRECALLDALTVLGLSDEERRKLEI